MAYIPSGAGAVIARRNMEAQQQQVQIHEHAYRDQYTEKHDATFMLIITFAIFCWLMYLRYLDER